MKPYKESAELTELIKTVQHIVIIQADNPDGDSLASALALENILGDLGKDPVLYCGVDIPAHLHYVPGWDRVSDELPIEFELSIIVDTSAISLLEQLQKTNQLQRIARKPCIVLDHHNVPNTIDFATMTLNYPVVSTGELIYELALQLAWVLNDEARNDIAVSILSDSLGLMTAATSARSIHIIGELVASGVNLPRLETARRDMTRKSPDLVHYKGTLLQRIEYSSNDRIATIDIPWEEIERYSPVYNPSVLALDEMRLTENTAVAIAFKIYKDGKITGKVRCNYGSPIAHSLAEHFGGGGHVYASGFKISDGRSLGDIKAACIAYATDLLDTINQEQSDETLQHTHPSN
jgi:phosphoesterase RecJ-like protein